MGGWRYEIQQVEHPLYRTYEGAVLIAGETEPIRCFLLLGRDHLTFELKSVSRSIPEELMQAWVTYLGSPAYGPMTHSRTGEIEEPFGEMILTATWRFRPEEREALQARIDGLLQKNP